VGSTKYRGHKPMILSTNCTYYYKHIKDVWEFDKKEESASVAGLIIGYIFHAPTSDQVFFVQNIFMGLKMIEERHRYDNLKMLIYDRKNLKGRGHSEDLGVDGRKILE
jgi:hypothetical protein